ncbi:hypothetical protein GCM10009639_66790 [Kitasatospora putterlickiae]|uniref:Uncharacterized protein n=1 Tax=Kitasatospora putterlickiae TaxID=221725 RepID=A0ABP4J5H5_9ACTN
MRRALVRGRLVPVGPSRLGGGAGPSGGRDGGSDGGPAIHCLDGETRLGNEARVRAWAGWRRSELKAGGRGSGVLPGHLGHLPASGGIGAWNRGGSHGGLAFRRSKTEARPGVVPGLALPGQGGSAWGLGGWGRWGWGRGGAA